MNQLTEGSSEPDATGSHSCKRATPSHLLITWPSRCDVTACLLGPVLVSVSRTLPLCLFRQNSITAICCGAMRCNISFTEAPCSYHSRGGPSPCHCRRT